MPRAALPQQYSRRLQRLLLLVNKMKTNPCQTPDVLWGSLGVPRALFYKDRQALAALGFTFHYNRQQHGYVSDDPRIMPLPLSSLLLMR